MSWVIPVELAPLGEVTSPNGVDSCGKNGEFHSFAFDGPMFHHPLAIDDSPLRTSCPNLIAAGATLPAALLFLWLATAASAQSAVRPISLAWDANPEPEVAGYIVHVGSISGDAQEHHDVGNNTSFVYRDALPAQRYYFTVSAYTVDRIESPPSDEVSATAVSLDSTAPSIAINGQAGLRYVSAGGLSGVTALPDGRLLLIENDRSLRLLAPGSSVPQTALEDLDASTAFTQIVVNAQFPSTHHVFIGVVNRRDEQTNEFSIIRYREVHGNLGEGAAVVAALQFYGAHLPRFTVDDQGHIYVAMPAASSRRPDPYASHILRFNADGTVPKESHAASPVFARGFSEPANLGWYGRELLATGSDDEWPHTVARLNVDAPATSWPQKLDPSLLDLPAKLRTAAIAVGNTDAKPWLRAFIDTSWRLFRLAQNPVAQTPTFEEIPLPAGAIPTAVAIGFDGRLLVIVRSAAGVSSLLEF